MNMKISRSTGYAVLAVGYIAQHKDQGIVLSQDVADAFEIPLEYLLKILQQLVRANILHSKRGPRGGFSLAKPVSKITLLDIIEAVDGPLTSQFSLAVQGKGSKLGAQADKVYQKAIEQARAVFAKTTIAELLPGRK